VREKPRSQILLMSDRYDNLQLSNALGKGIGVPPPIELGRLLSRHRSLYYPLR